MEKQAAGFRAWIKRHAAQAAAYSGLLVCIVFFTILTPIFGESIWSPNRLETLMRNVIVLALMSVGAVFDSEIARHGHLHRQAGGASTPR